MYILTNLDTEPLVNDDSEDGGYCIEPGEFAYALFDSGCLKSSDSNFLYFDVLRNDEHGGVISFCIGAQELAEGKVRIDPWNPYAKANAIWNGEGKPDADVRKG